MPKLKIKGNKGAPIQIEQPDTFTKNSEITDKEVFDSGLTPVKIKTITLVGDFVGIQSGTVIQVVGGEATIDVDIE